MYITDKDTDVIQNTIYSYKIVKNVISYDYKNYDTWDIATHDARDTGIEQIYMIIDTGGNDAFAHWITESAIYLLLFIDLKKIHPTLKLHLQCHKKYKMLFCEYFGIHKKDISLNLEPENMCIFPLPISALNKKTICHSYIKQIDAFVERIQSNITEKHINILVMPRQNKENYVGNDRVYDVSDILGKVSGDENNRVLNTDTIDTLQEQIDTVASSKNIILHGGAAYFVNGLISKNANMIVLDASHHIGQISEYPKLKYVDYLIRMNNDVQDIQYYPSFMYDTIKEYIDI